MWVSVFIILDATLAPGAAAYAGPRGGGKPNNQANSSPGWLLERCHQAEPGCIELWSNGRPEPEAGSES
jgi:hypothetical protein